MISTKRYTGWLLENPPLPVAEGGFLVVIFLGGGSSSHPVHDLEFFKMIKEK